MKLKQFSFWIILAANLAVSIPCIFAAENPAENQWEADMALIPAGAFPFGTDKKDEAGEALAMGVPKPWYADENPKQDIFLKGFYLDRYEVTNRRYKIFIDSVGAVPPDYWKNDIYPEGQEDFPVVWVNWYDAANFCGWVGKRLPTEKEWERAAKGAQGYDYPWGNEFKLENANLSSKAGSKNPVGKTGMHPGGASPDGIQDLIGNVWEWTADDYAPYKGSAYKSPEFEKGAKALRGASASYVGHFSGAAYLEALKKIARSGYRQPAYPDDGAEDVGFRCVSESEPKGMKTALSGESAAKGFGGSPKAPGFSKNSEPEGKASDAAKKAASFSPFAPKPNLPQSGILALIFLAFLAGIMSFLSPCTLPILPAYFAVTAQADRARMSMMSLAFFCGLATLFVMMGASVSFIGQILRDYIFSLTTIGGVLVAAFGIMTLFGKGFSGANFHGKPASTFAGSFFFGATFALGWTPCVGPILSGILILAASDKTVLQGMSLLFFYAVGLGSPLIIISVFFSQLKKDGLFWKILRGKGWNVQIGGRTLLLHSTNLFSGILLIALGVALAMGYMTYLNSLIPIEIQVWFAHIEEKVLRWFM